jgi:O-antigen/teichoic acid export membrane protein
MMIYRIIDCRMEKKMMDYGNIFRKIYKDSLLKNSMYLMTTNFTNLVLGFFFWIIASRYYTPNDIGIVSALFSSMSLISMISSIGLPTALLFYLPRDPKNANKIINSCIIVSIVVSTIFSMMFILGLSIWEPYFIPIFNSIGLITIFIIITMMTTVSTLMSGVFTAERRSSFHMAKESMFGIVKIFPLILLTGFGAMGIFISWGIGLVGAMIIGLILLYKTSKYFPNIIIYPIIKDMAKYSTGNYIVSILNSLPRLILPIMIVSLISTESAGYFFIAMTIASLLHGIPQSIGNAFLAESSDGDLWTKAGRAIKFNLLLLIPGLLLFTIFGKFVLGIFNPNYTGVTTTLIILVAASIPTSIISVFNSVRNAQKRVGSIIIISAITAIIAIILSVPLMAVLNIDGAALAYLISDTIGAIIIIARIKHPKEFTLKLLKGDSDAVTI